MIGAFVIIVTVSFIGSIPLFIAFGLAMFVRRWAS